MIPPMNVRRSHAKPADDLEPKIVDRLSVCQSATAEVERARPVPQIECHRVETPERATSPPGVAPSLESLEGAFAGAQRFPQLSPDLVDLAETALRIRCNLLEAAIGGDRRRLAAIGDRKVGLAARQAVKEPGPVEPGGAAAWIGLPVDEPANGLERLDVLGMLAQGELDLRLIDDGVDAPQAVRLRVLHRVEPAQRRLEMGDGLGV